MNKKEFAKALKENKIKISANLKQKLWLVVKPWHDIRKIQQKGKQVKVTCVKYNGGGHESPEAQHKRGSFIVEE